MFEKLTKNIMFDILGARFVPHSKKKANFQNGQKSGKVGQHGHNFVIFSQPTGQT